MQLRKYFVFVVLLSFYFDLKSQHLKPGYDNHEYLELMKISARTTADSSYFSDFEQPEHFSIIYRSAVMGLDNLWDLWINDDSVVVISLRGTTTNSTSWLGNFYAAMVPAKGQIQVAENNIFQYNLADNDMAAVHVGWLISTAYLAGDIIPKIDSLYTRGYDEMIILGHSQGAAIAFLLTAHLYQLQKQNFISNSIRFKTYCSAGPKPGNLYFAYEYENMTKNGWAFNVVNAADWVPETPISIQTLQDFNKSNPFVHTKSIIRHQKFPQKVAMNHVFNQLERPTRKAQKKYEKYLGGKLSNYVEKSIPGYATPEFYSSSNYVRTGNTIVLLPDSAYYAVFPDQNKIFTHHIHKPYMFLVEQQILLDEIEKSKNKSYALQGKWELIFIANTQGNFEVLYPEEKPDMILDIANNAITGTNSCNSYGGEFELDENFLRFEKPLFATKIYCPGEGERIFMDVLRSVDAYQLNADHSLSFLSDGKIVMQFKKQ